MKICEYPGYPTFAKKKLNTNIKDQDATKMFRLHLPKRKKNHMKLRRTETKIRRKTKGNSFVPKKSLKLKPNDETFSVITQMHSY